ncbi:MAG: TetR/AcrR family transcriptional regulator [Alistipes sp.]|nr:TetR/AcrR family transcriptional regulator [Alistipes sp.]MDE6861899.1 TetR/AcrR family transcriptional regulator [Alistipes sp.]
MTQKEHILDQVMSMFIAHGIKSVRMDDIARQLSISKRTLYEMFGDKEELLYQCIVKFTKDHEEERKQRFKSVDNYLMMMLIGLKEMSDNATVTNRMRENICKFYPKVYEKLVNEFEDKGRQGLRHWIELCIQQGWFMPNINVDLSLAILYNTANNMQMQPNMWLPEEKYRKEDILVYAMITYLRGMATPAGMEVIRDFCKRELSNKPYNVAL